jgi:DNA-binding PucR family transcriptional regulator
MKTTINNFDELVLFIEDTDLTMNEYNVIIKQTIGAFHVMDNKNELIESLKTYWNTNKNITRCCRRLFITSC